jgi:hypothetical protein
MKEEKENYKQIIEMNREDWISTKKALPEDSKDKKYLVHFADNNEVKICSYDHISHSFYDGDLTEKPYTVDRVDFWMEIKKPGEEEESMYRFHEGMVVRDWNNHIFVVKKVKERSYDAVVYGNPVAVKESIPIALQGKYYILKNSDIEKLLKPYFKEGMHIRRKSDGTIYKITKVVDEAKGKYYQALDENGMEHTILFGRQESFVRHFIFEDGDTVRKFGENTLYVIHKNKEEAEPVHTSVFIPSFYQTPMKLDFYMVQVNSDGDYTSYADRQISLGELENDYEIVQKHDESIDIKRYM